MGFNSGFKGLKCFYILRLMSDTLHDLFSYLNTVGFLTLCRPKLNLADKVFFLTSNTKFSLNSVE